MPETRPTNLYRQLCALEFRSDHHRNAVDLVGTINFNDTQVTGEKGVTAAFGIDKCTLEISMSSGNMPLETQLIQKLLPLVPIGDGIKDVTSVVDRERTGRVAVGAKGYAPDFNAELGGKLKDTETVAGKAYRPDYVIHVELCGDHEQPAWRIRSAAESAPIVGMIRDETFGRIVGFKEPVTVTVSVKARSEDLRIAISGAPFGRTKALKQLLMREFEEVFRQRGPLAEQQLKWGADEQL
ncbi:hypothetical protein ABIE89_008537 [Bradyrhizobium niftali]|uniref:hypothetical protein n=1 Tax=Bradyrhizobium niftali TaxID=2560055 RepID=UPI003837DE58